MYDYEEIEFEKTPRKPVRVLYNDFVKVSADAEAFENGLCQDPLLGPDYMFGNIITQKARKSLCWSPCLARENCLKHAVNNDIRFGVWGGFTEKERKAMKN